MSTPKTTEQDRKRDSKRTTHEQDADEQELAGDTGHAPSDLDAPEYYSKDRKPTVPKVGIPSDH